MYPHIYTLNLMTVKRNLNNLKIQTCHFLIICIEMLLHRVHRKEKAILLCK